MAIARSLAPGSSQGITCTSRSAQGPGPQWTSLIRAALPFSVLHGGCAHTEDGRALRRLQGCSKWICGRKARGYFGFDSRVQLRAGSGATRSARASLSEMTRSFLDACYSWYSAAGSLCAKKGAEQEAIAKQPPHRAVDRLRNPEHPTEGTSRSGCCAWRWSLG